MENKNNYGLVSQQPRQSYLGWGVAPEVRSTSQSGQELRPQNSYEMTNEDERFFFGPGWGWGWGSPFWGWGWGRPGWGGGHHHHHRQDAQSFSSPHNLMDTDERFFVGPGWGGRFPFFPFFPFFPGFGFDHHHHHHHRQAAQSSSSPYEVMPANERFIGSGCGCSLGYPHYGWGGSNWGLGCCRDEVLSTSNPYDMMYTDERFINSPVWDHHQRDIQPFSNPHEMMHSDERFFFGPGWGWGSPFWGWGWGRPGWGGGRPGWGMGHHR